MLGLESLGLKQLEALREHFRKLGEGAVLNLEGRGEKSKAKQNLNDC